MRRTEREIKDQASLERILRNAEVLYLGLLDTAGPYVVPLNFGWLDGHIYFHTAPAGRKMEALKVDPRVAFTVIGEQQVRPASMETACKWSARYRSVMGTGRAALLTEEKERRAGLDSIMSKFAPGPYTYAPEVLERTAVVRITVTSLCGKQAGF